MSWQFDRMRPGPPPEEKTWEVYRLAEGAYRARFRVWRRDRPADVVEGDLTMTEAHGRARELNEAAEVMGS